MMTRSTLARPAEDGVEMRVRRVRPAAQAIADPHVGAFVHCCHVGRKVMIINRIDDGLAILLGANAERRDAAMGLVDEAEPRLAYAHVIVDRLPAQYARISGAALESIRKAGFEPLQHGRARV